MTNHTNLHKELDLIQGIINRMANNSFMLKGWAVGLAVLVPAITSDSILQKQGFAVFLVLGIVVMCFWYLDAWFLHKERCYRKLYDAVREKRLAGNEEDMYGMNYAPYAKTVDSVWRIMGSVTLGCFYAVPLAVVVLLILLNFSK